MVEPGEATNSTPSQAKDATRGSESEMTRQRRVIHFADIVFIKVVPSGKFERRILEIAYIIYNPRTRTRISKSFLFHHVQDHAVHEDTFSDYHTVPTEGDGRSLLQLCTDPSVAHNTMEEFCAALTSDMNSVFPSTIRDVTFVGDHIWQTRSLCFDSCSAGRRGSSCRNAGSFILSSFEPLFNHLQFSMCNSKFRSNCLNGHFEHLSMSMAK